MPGQTKCPGKRHAISAGNLGRGRQRKGDGAPLEDGDLERAMQARRTCDNGLEAISVAIAAASLIDDSIVLTYEGEGNAPALPSRARRFLARRRPQRHEDPC